MMRALSARVGNVLARRVGKGNPDQLGHEDWSGLTRTIPKGGAGDGGLGDTALIASMQKVVGSFPVRARQKISAVERPAGTDCSWPLNSSSEAGFPWPHASGGD